MVDEWTTEPTTLDPLDVLPPAGPMRDWATAGVVILCKLWTPEDCNGYVGKIKSLF